MLAVGFVAGAALILTADHPIDGAGRTAFWLAVHAALYWRLRSGGRIALALVTSMAAVGSVLWLVGGGDGRAAVISALSLLELAAVWTYWNNRITATAPPAPT